jgi:pimeloyl-ACP methyl ester carboxylesterase
MKIIFIHGSGGCKESWKFQTDYFKDSEAINLPGHPDGDPCSSVEEYVDWLKSYIDEKGYKDLVLVGHSLGGGVVLLYALKYPGDLKGIIPLGSGTRLRVRPDFLEALRKMVSQPDTYKDFKTQESSLTPPDMEQIMTRRRLENGPAVMLSDLEACDRFDIMDRLADLKTPALALCGSEDIMTPPKYTQFMADRLPNCRGVVIPDGTHMVYVEKPNETNQAIEEFIREISE